MSMLRYYTTPETRQALIAESNRLIASRAGGNASRTLHEPPDAADSAPAALRDAAEDGSEPASVESAFARLVADLQSAAARSRQE